MGDVSCVADAGALLGEGALWDPDRGVVWWLDIRGSRLHVHDVRSGANRGHALARRLTALGLTSTRDLVACGDEGFVRLAISDDLGVAATTVLARPDEPPGNRFNDGAVDPAGRFWAGTMDESEREARGSLYRLDAHGLHRVIEGLSIPNGPCFLDDGTMLATDTAAGVITAHRLDAAGNVRASREFARFPASAGYPDGMARDAQNHVWIAFWDGGCLRRLDADGRVKREIALPVSRPTRPVFAGEQLDRLYVTSAAFGLDAAARARQPWAGGLLHLDGDVAGAPPARFTAR